MKIMITIDNTCKTRNESFSSFNIELSGKGTSQDPYMIIPDNSNRDMGRVVILISESKEHLIVDNIQVRGIKLQNCENIAFKNIKAKRLELEKCSSSVIQDIKIKKELKISNSIDISLENVEAGSITEIESHNISRVNCTITGWILW